MADRTLNIIDGASVMPKFRDADVEPETAAGGTGAVARGYRLLR
jgi:hypothetical protein